MSVSPAEKRAFKWSNLIRKVRDEGSWARISSRFSDWSLELCCSRKKVVEPMSKTSLVLDIVDVQVHDFGMRWNKLLELTQMACVLKYANNLPKRRCFTDSNALCWMRLISAETRVTKDTTSSMLSPRYITQRWVGYIHTEPPGFSFMLVCNNQATNDWVILTKKDSWGEGIAMQKMVWA